MIILYATVGLNVAKFMVFQILYLLFNIKEKVISKKKLIVIVRVKNIN